MSHYFSDEVTAASRPQRVKLEVAGLDLTLATDRGVFSPDRIDRGTAYLLRTGPTANRNDRTIVDVGAGYGPITVALATKNPKATVWAVEPNPRARQLCTANAADLGLTNVRVVGPEDPDVSELTVDRIFSNPPIRIGKKSLHELLLFWLGRLGPSGSAHLVVHKNLGSDSLAKWLGTQGFDVTRRGSEMGYRVLDVVPASGAGSQ